MLLELDPSTPIDFRKSMWGHALHSNTFKMEDPFVVKKRIIPFLPWPTRAVPENQGDIRRYSFMVHTSQNPRIGREVIWKSAENHEVTGVIYRVEPCGDPRDMMTLYVKVA